ncbi:MAG TPA: hypothetical protein VHD60_00360 [Candidatus Saccharimonadales bacterium]|nr:hypothetical protein [Candidatus Saccharimonadales bacterium]
MALATSALLIAGLVLTKSVSATIPGTNEGVSISTIGGSPNNLANQVSLSQNGRFAAFASKATNLVNETVSGSYDEVYVRDRLNDTTTLASISSSGLVANGDSEDLMLSADGRYVVFKSNASNLGSNGSTYHIFLHDMQTGATQIVDTNSNGVADGTYGSMEPSVSADGRYVVFSSFSTNLVTTPSLTSHSYSYVYLKDMQTGTVELLSIGTGGSAPNGSSGYPRIDCGGDEVAFYSTASDLVANDLNGQEDVFLYDQIDGTTKDITISSDGSSTINSISCNGEYMGVTSYATNLTAANISGNIESAYEYDRLNDKFTLASQSSDGILGNADSNGAFVSNDGRVVAFSSMATNLTSSDNDSSGWDIFLRNIETSTTEMIDINSSGVQANAPAYAPSLSANGKYVGYSSPATNLISGYGYTSGQGAAYVSETGVVDNY